jgi:hypothetical protein
MSILQVDVGLSDDIVTDETDQPIEAETIRPVEEIPAVLIERDETPARQAVDDPEPTSGSSAKVHETGAPAGVDVQEQARQSYRDSVADGTPLNGKQLGVLYERSERWGRDRIAEAKRTLPRAARRRAAGSRKASRSGISATARTAAVPPADGSPDGSTDGSPDGNVGTLPVVVAAAADDRPQRQSIAPAATGSTVAARAAGVARRWPLLLLAAPAFVAIWSGWVGLGEMTGFGLVHPLPGIADGFALNSAITLPIGVEAYAAYAMRGWLAQVGSRRAQRFARASAIGALILGGLGQVAYHLMSAAGISHAPWWITTFVACLPVVVLGFGAGLAHLQHAVPAAAADHGAAVS